MNRSEQNAEKSLFPDSLYCEEKQELVDFEEEQKGTDGNSLFPMLEQDTFLDDEELQSLFCKEKETRVKHKISSTIGRKEAVEWILRINFHYAFSPLTAILAVNYLDRFLSTLTFQKDKQPWMMQLAAVTCLSLAAKVEETHVPLLLDLQVEGTNYVFEAKTIQRMELLILSNLDWRMNPITPISFLDQLIPKLGLKSNVNREFLRSCENLLISIISDERFTDHLPSVMATATMLCVIHRFEGANASHYENQLLTVLKISKEEVRDCYEFLLSKNEMDIWEVVSCFLSSSPVLKKARMEEEEIPLTRCHRLHCP